MKKKQIKHTIKRKGWQDKLQNVYQNFEEFKAYCSVWGIHKRLGFKSIKKAWKTNPTMQGSTNPSDLCIVK